MGGREEGGWLGLGLGAAGAELQRGRNGAKTAEVGRGESILRSESGRGRDGVGRTSFLSSSPAYYGLSSIYRNPKLKLSRVRRCLCTAASWKKF